MSEGTTTSRRLRAVLLTLVGFAVISSAPFVGVLAVQLTGSPKAFLLGPTFIAPAWAWVHRRRSSSL
jgi:hypothetical protein